VSFPYELETTVLRGLPVLIKYSVRGEHRPATFDCPAEHEEIEYEVCDRRGRYAKWIEQRLADRDHDRILDAIERDRDYY